MQVKSRARVADHGEVYTNLREVNAMLDLVADQVTDFDKTFLEPACGTGNFLAVILERRLHALTKKHKKLQYDFEKYAIIAVGTMYGIELLPDNVAECRERLLGIFSAHYKATFPKTYKQACIDSIAYLLSKNILCGDALTLQTHDGAPIIFSKWQLIGSQIQRDDYVYRDLLDKSSERDLPLFSDLGEEAHIPDAIATHTYPHFLELHDDGSV
ncbi:hypothetical protein B0181_03685 [Moraxella caviae]|uniref:MmeI-like DNA-methyltransferase domain-containing protein n=1 Tax=Moraxella caviae TaxID=34060 RepID=A0A1T0A5N1_9GAMM|nr:DNA methyltransferase [Moraxella caviae]OOR91046.1 hypothetical protein B0181_03685 [Moraxella caviae]STZ14264.1 Uncharacterised protein [Moraxella caviae]VEW12913.1 Uncharacterised protein [Moraxella caviae]